MTEDRDLFEGVPAAAQPGRAPEEPRIWTVAEANHLAAQTLKNIGEIWVEGEISNFHRHGSGHLYFSIKDDSAAMDAAMFRGSAMSLQMQPRDGLRVRIRGELTVYEQRGRYQIVVREMRPAGKGALFEAFEKLKKELAARGWFDRKRPLPWMPRRIGVVTSTHTAALRDILNVLGRRCPIVPVLISPCRVQGEGAAAEIAQAIRSLQSPALGIETIIVARGGGSIEDLWAFNEEPVARAVFESAIPVISGVGHETDFTMCDFVADLRAPTPSAAAEHAVPDISEIAQQLPLLSTGLRTGVSAALQRLRLRLRTAAGSRVFHEPRAFAQRQGERVRHLEERMRWSLRRQVETRAQAADEAGRMLRTRFIYAAAQAVAVPRTRLDALAGRLRDLNPRAVLRRGYSIARTPEGRVIGSIHALKTGDVLTTEFHDGRAESIVQTLAPDPRKETP